MDGTSSPIFSNREDESDLWEEIERFVVELAERVDALQDAEGAADLNLLRNRSEELRGQAQELGFPALAQLAGRVAGACAEEKADIAQEALVELTDHSQRVRLGHRGAL